MVEILRSSFFEALGWSLIDSLWQNGILWGLYCALTLNGKKYSSSARHNLAFLFSLSGTSWFFITLYQYASGAERFYSVQIDQIITLSQALPVLACLYLLMLFIYCARIFLQKNTGNHFYNRTMLSAGEQWNKCVEQMASQMKINRRVKVWFSAAISSPLTIGIFKPVILLPVAIMNQLSVAQVEAIIAHELYHIKKFDYALNLLLVISEAVLFFNPFANMMAAIARKERENRCDDNVIAMNFNAWEYAQALYLISHYNHPQKYSLLLAAAGSSNQTLLLRIKRLLKIDQPSPSVLKPICTFFLCLAIAVFAGRSPSGVAVLKEMVNSNEVVLKGKEVLILTAPEPIRELAKPQKAKVSINKKVVSAITIHVEGDDAEEQIEAVSSQVISDFHINYPTYINDEEALEFTILEPALPELPQTITERPLPYVPGSTFFYPLDTLKITVEPARKVIHI